MIYKFVNLPIIIEVKNGVLEEFEEVIHQNNLHFENPLLISGEKSGEIIRRYNFAGSYKHYTIYNATVEEISNLKHLLSIDMMQLLLVVEVK